MSADRPSPPFLGREFNGTLLLEEFQELRDSHVGQSHLVDTARALRSLRGGRVSEAQGRLRQFASGRLQGQPALASLLVRWAARLKVEPDVDALVSHFERLALTAALLGALRGAQDALEGVHR